MSLYDMPLIDWKTFERTRRMMGHELSRVFGYLLEDGAKSLTHIERALRELDAVKIVAPAHSIKGDALHFGAAQLAVLASQIEYDARDCIERKITPAALIADVAKLRPLFDESIAALERAMSAGYEKRRAA